MTPPTDMNGKVQWVWWSDKAKGISWVCILTLALSKSSFGYFLSPEIAEHPVQFEFKLSDLFWICPVYFEKIQDLTG